ncbi:MAG TPA: hypothetical protein VEW42_04330 [Candidatus Eisenbacteria bacterium]|nr:hypothetical protein [Candidatus Eisenbacteria bacterium]
MGNLLNSWQFYVVIGIIADVVFTQNYKLAVNNAKNDSAAVLLLDAIAAITILIWVPLYPFAFSTNIFIYILLFIGLVFGTINDRLKVTARKNLPAGESAILNELTGAIIIIVGFLVLGQPFILLKAIGALLIFIANGLLIYRKGKFVFNKYTLLFILACFVLSVEISLDIGFTKYFNLPFYISIVFLISALIIGLVTKTSIREIKREWIPGSKIHYLLTGTAWALAFLSTVKAAQLGPIVVIVPLMSLSVLLNVLIARHVHSEKEDLGRKVIAALIIFAGLLLTVWH